MEAGEVKKAVLKAVQGELKAVAAAQERLATLKGRRDDFLNRAAILEEEIAGDQEKVSAALSRGEDPGAITKTLRDKPQQQADLKQWAKELEKVALPAAERELAEAQNRAHAAAAEALKGLKSPVGEEFNLILEKAEQLRREWIEVLKAVTKELGVARQFGAHFYTLPIDGKRSKFAVINMH